MSDADKMADASKPALRRFDGFVPERAPIDAYGNGGFRFAGMSHRGSIFIAPDGTHAWAIDEPETAPDMTGPLLALLERLQPPQFLLVGAGRRQIFPAAIVRAAFLARQVGLDVMDTGAACRTFNVLIAERRPVMAALAAVE